jgi:hypothetical protein
LDFEVAQVRKPAGFAMLSKAAISKKPKSKRASWPHGVMKRFGVVSVSKKSMIESIA